jgi:soluble lytic murein transglycosylase-like protein/cell division protein FtsN
MPAGPSAAFRHFYGRAARSAHRLFASAAAQRCCAGVRFAVRAYAIFLSILLNDGRQRHRAWWLVALPSARMEACARMTRAPLASKAIRFVQIGASLAILAGCAHRQTAHLSAPQEAAQYAAHAKNTYTPPGPPEDPWGPYVTEAAARYDVPEVWIRSVMRQESGGNEYENGELITSGAGAMGLMQVMPETYDELRQENALGDDPYDPHDNIMAGAAYIREMYDLYGSPGFLAAYNAGPKRLDDYLQHNRPLPDETRHYVASIGPYIAGVYPQRPSQAQQYAMNDIPIDIPPGPRYPHNHTSAPVALAAASPTRYGTHREQIAVADLPSPPPPPPPAAPAALAAPKPGHSFQLIPKAMADTLPVHAGGPATGNWAIQVGAFSNESQAHAAAEAAKGQARIVLASARLFVGTVHQPKGVLYRARLTGLSRDAAIQACEKLSHHGNCMVLSPDVQS